MMNIKQKAKDILERHERFKKYCEQNNIEIKQDDLNVIYLPLSESQCRKIITGELLNLLEKQQ